MERANTGPLVLAGVGHSVIEIRPAVLRLTVGLVDRQRNLCDAGEPRMR